MGRYSGPKRGPARLCAKCGRVHYSAIYDTCVTCRGRAVEPKRLDPAAIQRRRAAEQRRLEERDARARAKQEREDARRADAYLRQLPKRGRCRRAERMAVHSPLRTCSIFWGRVDHDHCPEPECGRPMAAGQPRCSRCDALLILQAPAMPITASSASEPVTQVAVRPMRMPTLAEELDEEFPSVSFGGATT